MTYFCLILFQCALLPEVGIVLEIFFFFFSPAARRSQEFPDTKWGGTNMSRWVPRLVASAATAGSLLACVRAFPRLWACELCIGQSTPGGLQGE